MRASSKVFSRVCQSLSEQKKKKTENDAVVRIRADIRESRPLCIPRSQLLRRRRNGCDISRFSDVAVSPVRARVSIARTARFFPENVRAFPARFSHFPAEFSRFRLIHTSALRHPTRSRDTKENAHRSTKAFPISFFLSPSPPPLSLSFSISLSAFLFPSFLYRESISSFSSSESYRATVREKLQAVSREARVEGEERKRGLKGGRR